MTPAQLDLLRKIESFDIDGGPAQLPFAARLARENGWSRAYADRVVSEYQRYLFLATCSDVPRCPSEDVDTAWHLHLTYTRSYWQRFCGDVLGRPLHHEPTRGGPSEGAKHFAMYDATLAAYRELFGKTPPADIWPPTAQRFGDDVRQRKVNVARNWVIPKRIVKRTLQLTVAFVVAALVLPGCDGGLNPFELKGAEFLLFFIPALIVAIILGRIIRSMVRGEPVAPNDDGAVLSWEHAAYLAGGYPRLTSAAIARMAEDNVISVVGDKLEAGKRGPNGRSAVEQTIFSHLPISKSDLKPVVASVEAGFSDEAATLESDGYTIDRPTRFRGRVIGLVPLAIAILMFGVPRLIMGLMNNKPVAFLVVTLIVGAIAGAITSIAGSRLRSRRGDHVLEQMREQNKDTNPNAGLAVALFGTAILVGTGLAYINDWYPRPRSTGADGGCGTGCGGAGCGGGGGGGCGSGCGGCGGGGGD